MTVRILRVPKSEVSQKSLDHSFLLRGAEGTSRFFTFGLEFTVQLYHISIPPSTVLYTVSHAGSTVVGVRGSARDDATDLLAHARSALDTVHAREATRCG